MGFYHRISFVYSALLILFIPVLTQAQTPRNNQSWNTNATLSSDTLTIQCSTFQLPFFLGRILSETNSIGTRNGEMSESMSSPHDIKVTLQPESTTSDDLVTISGCSVDGTILMLLVADAGDSITIRETGNIDLGPSLTELVHTGNDLPLWFVLRGSTWLLVGGGGTSGGGAALGLNSAHSIYNAIEGADGSRPLIITDGLFDSGTSDYWSLYIDATGDPNLRGFCAGAPCSTLTLEGTDGVTLKVNSVDIVSVHSLGATIIGYLDAESCGGTITSSPHTVSGTCSNMGIFYNGSDTAKEFDLPPDAAGKQFCFHAGTFARVLTIDPDSGDTIVLGGTSASAGEAIVSSGSTGEFICLHGQDTDTWQTWGAGGTWAEEIP